MKTKPQNPYILPLLLAIVVAVMLIGLLIFLLVADPGRANRPAPTETTQTTTEATQAPTLPSPAANPYTMFDFAYDEHYLTCTAGISTVGIDVSEWQSEVDWEAVKNSGVEFVMIRVGWRGSERGVLTADTLAQSHYEGAKAAGLKVGAYFFAQAISVEEAKEEAAFALSLMEGWELDMPMVYDWEYIDERSRTAWVSARTLTDATKAFCEAVEAAGYSPMIYFSESQASHRLFLEELTDYQFWLALYLDGLDYPYRVDMWQYTCTGSVPGITGDVDINLHFTYENPN